MTEQTEDRIVSAPTFDSWAIVELMGHRIRAGRAQEVELAGGKMLRVDIPTDDGDVTEFYSTSAIYSLRPCTEEIARKHCEGYGDPRPVRPVSYRERDTSPQIDYSPDYEDDDMPI